MLLYVELFDWIPEISKRSRVFSSPRLSFVHTGARRDCRVKQISPDGTTIYAAGYAHVPPPAVDASPPSADAELSRQIPSAVVWRYEMKPSERRALAALAVRMEAFQGGGCKPNRSKCFERVVREDVTGVRLPSR